MVTPVTGADVFCAIRQGPIVVGFEDEVVQLAVNTGLEGNSERTIAVLLHTLEPENCVAWFAIDSAGDMRTPRRKDSRLSPGSSAPRTTSPARWSARW